MSTMNRIGVTPHDAGEGSSKDELLSGESVLSEPPTLRRGEEPVSTPPPPASEEVEIPIEEDEPIPETLRSSVLVLAHEPVSRPIVIEEVGADEGYRAA
ncbi:MAG: hypothetical protein K0S65_2927 [Labilithrix sp.]|nr:hypothetical protein [Labilithrix sp.]